MNNLKSSYVEIQKDYESAIDLLNELSDSFRDFCVANGETSFNFNTFSDCGDTFAEDEYDYDIMLSLVSAKDIKKLFPEAGNSIDILSKLIYTHIIYIVEEYLDKLWNTTTYKEFAWFKNVLMGTKEGKELYKQLLLDGISSVKDCGEEEDLINLLYRMGF